MKLLIFLISVLFIQYSPAEIRQSGLLNHIDLGARYLSLMQKRGVTLYSDFQIDPVVRLYFLNNEIEFLGNSLSYKDFFVDEVIRYRFQILRFTDRPLFPNHKSLSADFYDREDTFEVAAGLEFFLESYQRDYWGEIDVTLFKDIAVHHGYYLELQSLFKITQVQIKNLKVEPHFLIQVGWGNQSNNEYYYGPSANSEGVNNWTYGLSFELPENFDRSIQSLQLIRYETLGASRKEALYASGHNEGYQLSLQASVRLFE